jgi:protease IV
MNEIDDRDPAGRPSGASSSQGRNGDAAAGAAPAAAGEGAARPGPGADAAQPGAGTVYAESAAGSEAARRVEASGSSADRAGDGAAVRGWEREMLEKLVMATVEERRRARRWSIFFRLTGIVLLVGAVAIVFGTIGGGAPKTLARHTALVELRGVIDAEHEASSSNVIEGLQAAFADTNTAGVVLRINSPGGSPVQAGIIYDEIKRLRAKHPSIPLYAVVEDICASGSYYVAAAADRIYVDKASMVGSIGVLMDGYGLVGTLEKLGVERRLLTAGENKAMLDSFSPLTEKHRAYAQSLIDEIHRQFIDAVRKGRGDRLKDSPEIFSGLVWNGSRSVELGLADATGSLGSVARDVVKAEEVVDFSARQNLAERLAKRVGVATGQAFAGGLGAWLSAPTLR